MEQRELTDKNGTRWTCVQAYTGPGSENSETAKDVATDEENKIAVVCTPTGGAQSVRLRLKKNWLTELPEEKLLKKITSASDSE